ncbi:MAG: hypothetical protein AB7F67_15450 [Rhodospirillaceae bacterium]
MLDANHVKQRANQLEFELFSAGTGGGRNPASTRPDGRQRRGRR